MTTDQVIRWVSRWIKPGVMLYNLYQTDETKFLPQGRPKSHGEVYMLCSLLGDFAPEDLTPDALIAIARTVPNTRLAGPGPNHVDKLKGLGRDVWLAMQ